VPPITAVVNIDNATAAARNERCGIKPLPRFLFRIPTGLFVLSVPGTFRLSANGRTAITMP
jgi:hypothetical protein